MTRPKRSAIRRLAGVKGPSIGSPSDDFDYWRPQRGNLMSLLELLVSHVGGLSLDDIPSARSIFGGGEFLIPTFAPIAEGRDPTEEDVIDLLTTMPGLGGRGWSPGPARDTLVEGKKNVRDYIQSSPRAGRDTMAEIEAAAKAGRGDDDPRLRKDP